MKISLITDSPWKAITSAVKKSRRPVYVAVAFLGKGATKMLPLPSGSRLLVDASERTVAAGQTCPAELELFLNLGVRIYRLEHLHAKVFVIGNKAFIGSTNVSRNSEKSLIEALVCTTDSDTVVKAKGFIEDLCLQELTPEIIKKLKKLYCPPIFEQGSSRSRTRDTRKKRLKLNRVVVAQLEYGEWPTTEKQMHNDGKGVAKKRMNQPRVDELESFRWEGRCIFKRGDTVIQSTSDGKRTMISRPGNVLNVRTRRYGRNIVSYVYLEVPPGRRRNLEKVADSFGRGGKRLLRFGGVVRKSGAPEKLLRILTKQ